jgi:hypothetical protein
MDSHHAAIVVLNTSGILWNWICDTHTHTHTYTNKEYKYSLRVCSEWFWIVVVLNSRVSGTFVVKLLAQRNERGVLQSLTWKGNNGFYFVLLSYICRCVRYKIYLVINTKCLIFPPDFKEIWILFGADVRIFDYRQHIAWGVAVAQLVEVLRYKPERRGFYSRWCH